jgi:hypothetical protein
MAVQPARNDSWGFLSVTIYTKQRAITLLLSFFVLTMGSTLIPLIATLEFSVKLGCKLFLGIFSLEG